jgi:hypothetical protein
MWQVYDRGATREELAHIAALGCDTVRFCLLWHDFQPAPERLGSTAMRALEHALDAAQSVGLRVVAALFPVAAGGALMVPSWANGPDVVGALKRGGRQRGVVIVRPPGHIPVLTENGYRPVQTGDLFSEPSILEAQRYLVREVAGYFGAHPALWAWQLGEGFERVHRPDSQAAVRGWFANIGDELRRARPGARLLGVLSARGLGLQAGPRPEELAPVCDLLGVAADPPELPTEPQRRHTAQAAFLHALAAGLAGRRTLVTSLGMPLAGAEGPGWRDEESFGRTIQVYSADVNGQARFVEAALERLYRDGAAGAWLGAYADYPEELWQLAPLDRSMRQRSLGLIDAAGREKLAAEAVRAFANTLQAARYQPHPPPPAVDPERYWHNPRRTMHELWEEFNTPEA